MAILEKEIFVGICNNLKYYEDKGYDVPKYLNKGRLHVKRGTKILVAISDLPSSSAIKVTKICDDCGCKVPNQFYYNIIKYREYSGGIDRCMACSAKHEGKRKKENILYLKSFEYYAINNEKLNLIKEFSVKNVKEPKNISYGTAESFIWNCLDCGNEYKMRLTNRTSHGQSCPYCAGKKVNHTNCLWTTHPEVAELLTDKEIGYETTAGSNTVQEFVCPSCSNVRKLPVNQVRDHGLSCPQCADGVSYPEKVMSNVLIQLGLNFERQKTFTWSSSVSVNDGKELGSKRYDFYLSDYNCIIETHGSQHFKDGLRGDNWKSYEEEVLNDEFKRELALRNGISNYIIIDCMYSEIDYIKENILGSILSQFLNLEKVDWEICHKNACNSLVKRACDLWKEGLESSKEIGEVLDLSSNTIVKYLKRGAILGWCDYDPIKAVNKHSVKNGKANARQVTQFDLNGKQIKIWNSVRLAGDTLGITPSCIANAARGVSKTSGGFKWSYG